MHRLRNDERERPQLIAAAAAVAAPTFLIRAALLSRLSGDVAAGDWLEPVDQVGHLVFRFAPVEHRRCGNLRRRDIHVAVRTCRNSIGSDHLRIARIGTVLAIGANSTDGFGLDGCQIEVARIVDRESAVVWLVGVRAIPSITTPCLASLSHTTMLDGTPKLLIGRTKPSGTFPPFFLWNGPGHSLLRRCRSHGLCSEIDGGLCPSSTGMAPIYGSASAVGEVTKAASRIYGGVYQGRATRLIAEIHKPS